MVVGRYFEKARQILLYLFIDIPLLTISLVYGIIYRNYRRLSSKTLLIILIGATLILLLSYSSYVRVKVGENSLQTASQPEKIFAKNKIEICPSLRPSRADIDTLAVHRQFDFEPVWLKSAQFWDSSFETRYKNHKSGKYRPPLKVIVVPHSHNDPGWLQTFDETFSTHSLKIINNMVAGLKDYQNLTFIWSEISLLNEWWARAYPEKRRVLKTLVNSGRLEIVTGGWVMADEATTHIYGLLDQLIEGHQWLLKNLDVKPKYGWSVDPFGHGSTNPYLLASSGIKGTVIQRVHFAWKQWLANNQFGDFKWIPAWSTSNPTSSILTHNNPFDTYSTQHSCGPLHEKCAGLDFRSLHAIDAHLQGVDNENLKNKSEMLLGQLDRTGFLFPHNVVLFPLGDDFSYTHFEELKDQYMNYTKLLNYINENKDTYDTEIKFGTIADYFEEITRRHSSFPSLRGDFFVYAEAYMDHAHFPSYWSGFYTTRPYPKILGRQLEHHLRTAEILFTIAFNVARQKNRRKFLETSSKHFERIIEARRNLGLFQHHDAITGTSTMVVMRDFSNRLFESLRQMVLVQQSSLESLVFKDSLMFGKNLLVSDEERSTYEKLPKKMLIVLGPIKSRRIVLFNSLGQHQEFLVQVRVATLNVTVVDVLEKLVPAQINPVWDADKMFVSAEEYELSFVAKIPGLATVTYQILPKNSEPSTNLSKIYCTNCQGVDKQANELNADNTAEPRDEQFLSVFDVRRVAVGDAQLENDYFKISFDNKTGFMTKVLSKTENKTRNIRIVFSSYKSVRYRSGAFLFMPEKEKDVLQKYAHKHSWIVISGPVFSEIKVVYGVFLTHTLRIYHVGEVLSRGIYMENEVDFEQPPKNCETELFMRILSSVKNGDPPRFYTDLNGFQMQERVKVRHAPFEGNYFPITTNVFIQDKNLRLSLLTDHAQGATSKATGEMEVMIDRMTFFDDFRGIRQGLFDNLKTVQRLWLLLESIGGEQPKTGKPTVVVGGNDTVRQIKPIVDRFVRPSLFSNHLSNSLNYPINIYVVDADDKIRLEPTIKLINNKFPCDVHLVNLRTQVGEENLPSSTALMIFHRQGYDCLVTSDYICKLVEFDKTAGFEMVETKKLQLMSLTGTDILLDDVKGLFGVRIEPMALQTLNVVFK